MGNIHRITHSSSKLLNDIGIFVNGVGRIYPTGRDGVFSCFSRQAYSQCVSEGSNATFSSCIDLGLWLTHAVA